MKLKSRALIEQIPQIFLKCRLQQKAQGKLLNLLKEIKGWATPK